MKKVYSDFFKRPMHIKNEYDKSLYDNDITTSNNSLLDSKKYQDLFKNCFSHHVEPNVYLKKNLNESLHFLKGDKKTDKFFEEDNISSYFLSTRFEPPFFINYHTSKKKKKELINIIDKQYNIENYNEDENYLSNSYFIEQKVYNFKAFAEDVTKRAFQENDVDNDHLGSNVIRYLIGDIGQGKSTLVAYLYRDIIKNQIYYDNELLLIPVHVNIDFNFEDSQETEPRDLKEYFFSKLYRQTYMAVKVYLQRLNSDIDIKNYDYEKISSENKAIEEFEIFTKFLAKRNFRLLLFIDNIDRFHYFYARYAFFEEGKNALDISINSLEWMMKQFEPNGDLGAAGLGVLFVMRKYVYDYTFTECGLTTCKDNNLSTYEMIPVPFKNVVYSRAILLKETMQIVQKNVEQENWQLGLFLDLLDKIIDLDNNSTLKRITDLGHHGYRSLVDFISSLSIDIRDAVLFERFFTKQTHSLLMLYILNHKQRYAQRLNHFPNIYLNDCVISNRTAVHRFKNAHKEHKHTYWLKYFILKYLVKEEGATFHKIYTTFLNFFPDEDHLIKHVLGSLCTANEFRCAEVPLVRHQNPDSAIIYPTQRGRILLSNVDFHYPDVEFCMDFDYLRLIIDDDWLSYPKKYINEIYNSDIDYEHLFFTNLHNYQDESFFVLKKTSRSVLMFIKILQDSLKYEFKIKKDYESFLKNEGLLPNLDDVVSSNIESIERILKGLDKQGKYNPREDWNRIKLDYGVESFFESYQKANSPVIEPE